MAAMEDIRDIRRQLGLTQIEFADRLGLHQSTISRMEGGSLPLDKRTTLAAQALLARSGEGVANASSAVIEVPSAQTNTADSGAASPGISDGISRNDSTVRGAA